MNSMASGERMSPPGTKFVPMGPGATQLTRIE